MADRLTCGNAYTRSGIHEDSWPTCTLPFGHVGQHVEGRTGRTWSDEPVAGATPAVPGGANRDPHPERKPANWFSVDLESVRAIAETHYEGDTRYGFDNWRKGLPASNLLNHAMEHLFLMLEGDTSEPHLEHAIWGLGKLRWMAKHKPELIDVPMVRKALGMGATVLDATTLRGNQKLEFDRPRCSSEYDTVNAPDSSRGIQCQLVAGHAGKHVSLPHRLSW